MSTSPTRDPQTEERFLAWLAKRDPAAVPDAPAQLATLGSLGGLDCEGAAFAEQLNEAGLDDADTEALLRLHAAWTRFRRHEREEASGVAWVGRQGSATPAEAVTWVGAGGATGDAGPRGPAPSLLAPGARPVRPDVPARGVWRMSDLVVPLCLIASVLLLLVPVALERLALRDLRSQAILQLREELSREARPSRLALQASQGAWLREQCDARLRAVNAHCEGGPWCQQRVEALNATLQLADSLVADARARGSAPDEDWRPPQELLDREVQGLQRLLTAEAAGGADENASRRRRVVLEAELSVLPELVRP